ncbi:hypothetical protein Apa02nite_071000 [Actinoplanes palleronii]|uniref:Uncharacterized protein n=1 Tax=Actinoplanes palleronii TaxID=113570 RepID=A0ABQ4BK31_9ACTN|nr:hypothetical protein Apa02nite_071000 [Actinoplanes palleronii]
MNSGTDSEMTYLVPSTRVTTVSGVQSTRSTRSGFSANTAPLIRVTRIKTVPSLVRPWLVEGPPWPYAYYFGAIPVADEIQPVAIRVRAATIRGSHSGGRGRHECPAPAAAGQPAAAANASC